MCCIKNKKNLKIKKNKTQVNAQRQKKYWGHNSIYHDYLQLYTNKFYDVEEMDKSFEKQRN